MTDAHDAKVMADGASVAIGIGNVMQWLPPVISLVTSIVILGYMAVRLWETDTVKNLVAKYAKHE
jgi:hypothetical protein